MDDLSAGVLTVPPATAKLSHYLFRFPAKFHPPVARALLDRYTKEGETVLDPFVGSGTLLVEAAVANRNGIGTDVDPLAVLISRVKTHRYAIDRLKTSCASVLENARRCERVPIEYDSLMTVDLSVDEYQDELGGVAEWVPAIPNLLHWFRRYVVIDLANIRRVIEQAEIPETHREFLLASFAGSIRNSSNADPVPVSGLEVTAHMKQRDANGRRVNPFELWRIALRRALTGAEAFYSATNGAVKQRAYVRDAAALTLPRGSHVDAVITSPPYHGAVDYYRRHQLEMFWLGLTRSQHDRLALLPKYIGRAKVAQRDPMFNHSAPETRLVEYWHDRLSQDDVARARAFRHYITAMARAIGSVGTLLAPGSPVVFVVGDSGWRGDQIPTQELFQELAGNDFVLKEVLQYPVKNRYMSYARHNGANISREWVLALIKS